MKGRTHISITVFLALSLVAFPIPAVAAEPESLIHAQVAPLQVAPQRHAGPDRYATAVEIARAAYEFQKKIEAGRRRIVGVNAYANENDEIDIPILKRDEEVESKQRAGLERLRGERDDSRVEESLTALKSSGVNNSFFDKWV